MTMKKLRINRIKELTITRVLQIGFSATLIVVLLLFTLMYYTYTSNLLKSNIQNSLKNFAISAQYIIDGDIHEQIASKDDPMFQKLCQELANYKRAVDIYDVYTLTRGDETHTQMFLAAYDADKTFKRPYHYSPEMKAAFDGKPSVTREPYQDDFGTFYSGYAPLLNSKGETVAIVAVDIDIHQIEGLKREIVVKTLLLFAICFILGNIFVYFVANSLGKGFNRIIKGLKRIGDGDLTQRTRGKLPMIAEMEDLDHTVNDMAERIRKLVQIITQNAEQLRGKTTHLSELLVTTDLSSQMMHSTIEQMSRIHQDASSDFNQSLSDLLMYKEDSESNGEAYKNLLNAVESTKDNLEAILSYLHSVEKNANQQGISLTQESIESFEIVCQRLYKQYDLFTNSVNAQMIILDRISDKRNGLVDINQKIAHDFTLITQGNQRVIGAMEKQVNAIHEATKDIAELESMANELTEKLSQLNTGNADVK